MKIAIVIFLSTLLVTFGPKLSTDSSFRVVFEITGETEPITSSLWHPVENTIAVVTENGRIRIVNVETQRELKRLPESFRWVGKPAWSHDGNMFAYLSDGKTITILNSNYDPIKVLEFAAAQDSALWWSDAGDLIAFPDRLHQMHIWDSTSWTDTVVELAPGSTLWTASGDLFAVFDEETGAVEVWSVRDKRRLFQLIEQSNPLSGMVFNHDSSLLATIDNPFVSSEHFVSEPGIRIWRTDIGERAGSFELTIGTSLVWSPLNDRFLAFLDPANGIGLPYTLDIVDEDFESQQSIDIGSVNYIVSSSVVWTPDGRYISFAENRVPHSDVRDGDVQLWMVDSTTFQVLERYPIVYEPLFAQWSFDGQYLFLQSDIVQVFQPPAALFSTN